MELEKQPQTEMEYWAAIESLGGFIWQMGHDLSHGRIEDPKGSVSNEIGEAREIQKKLVTEIYEKFGVIDPQTEGSPGRSIDGNYPPAPEGKQWYWAWYYKMKEVFIRAENEKIICSACPLFDSGNMSTSGIACKVFPGSLYQLIPPHQCAMIDCNIWTRKKLISEISKKGGIKAVIAFGKKEQELTPKETVS